MEVCTIYSVTLSSYDGGQTFFDANVDSSLYRLSAFQCFTNDSIIVVTTGLREKRLSCCITRDKIVKMLRAEASKLPGHDPSYNNLDGQVNDKVQKILSHSFHSGFKPDDCIAVVKKNSNPWRDYLEEFLLMWVLQGKDRAGRLAVTLKYTESLPFRPFRMDYQVQFIKYGNHIKIPFEIKHLVKNLQKFGTKSIIDNDVYKKLKFDLKPLRQVTHNITCLLTFQLKSGNTIKLEHRFEVMPIQSNTVSVNKLVDNRDPWETYILCSFEIWARNHPNCDVYLFLQDKASQKLTIGVKKFSGEDLKLLSIFLQTLTMDCEKWTWQTKGDVVTTVEAFCNFIPIVGAGLALRDAVKNFKKGNTKDGFGNLALGVAGLACDVTMFAGPAAGLIRASTKSAKVLKACDVVTKNNKTLMAVGRIAGAVKTSGSKEEKKASSPGKITFSDPDIGQYLFPELCV